MTSRAPRHYVRWPESSVTGELSSDVVRINPDDRLYRRINLDSHIKRDGSIAMTAYLTRERIPDAALSVDLARLTTPEEALARARRPARTCIGELVAAVPLNLGLTVRHVPQHEDGQRNPAHCQIEGRGRMIWSSATGWRALPGCSTCRSGRTSDRLPLPSG